ncbi:hypothetical protein EBS02_05595, partial [bacterium]|nr:hypothetical protein [bacterium]
MKLNEDFKITDYDHNVANTAIMELIGGIHDGVKFYFGAIRVEEVNDEAMLHFEYNTVGDYETTLNEQDKAAFDKMMGDVVLSILMDNLEKREHENANRKQDS